MPRAHDSLNPGPAVGTMLYAVFVFAHKLFIYRSPHVHMALECVHRLCRGRREGGGGHVILKRTDNPRKEFP